MEKRKLQKNLQRNLVTNQEDKPFRNLSTPKRSFVKGVVWEAISFVVTSFAVFAVYGNFNLSVKFSFYLTLIKIVLFFVHERAWKKVKWGKI